MNEATDVDGEWAALEFRVLSRIQNDRVSGRTRSFQEYLDLFPVDDRADVAKILIENRVIATRSKTGAGPDSTRPKFAILERLGSGSDADVFRARHADHDGPVALKIFKNVMAPGGDLPERVREEARRTADLKHPAIADIHDVGVIDGRAFIAMRYVEGRTLADVVSLATGDEVGDAKHPWGTHNPIRNVAAFFAKLARAVGYCHSNNVLHRDLSPRNVMVTEHLEPVILDFGVSKIVAADVVSFTQKGDRIGTPAYVAPEVLRKESYGHLVDVYAVGLLLFEALFFRPMFSGATTDELDRAILAGPSPEIRDLLTSLPTALRVIIETASASEPRRRYRTADALADDLEAFLAGRPIAARPPNALMRSFMWCRRHRVAAIGGSTFLSMLVMVTVASVKTARAESRARELETARSRAEREIAATNRRNEARRYVTAAEVVAKQGNLAGALAFLEEATRMGFEDRVELALCEAEVRWYLDQRDKAEGIILELMRNESALGRHRARALVLAGDITTDRSETVNDGVEKYQEAIASGLLTPADAAYARAMVAPTLFEVRDLLRKALTYDPLHLRANDQLGTILVLTADFDAALVHATKLDVLMPTARDGQHLRFIVGVLKNDVDLIADAARVLEEKGFETAESLALVKEMLQSAGRMLNVGPRGALDSDKGAARMLRAQSQTVGILGDAITQSMRGNASAMRLRVPVALSRLLSPFITKTKKSSLGANAQGLIDFTFAMMTDEVAIDGAIGLWPDAMLYFSKARIRFSKRDDPGTIQAADEALRRPGFLDVRPAAAIIYHLAYSHLLVERYDLAVRYRDRHREVARIILGIPDLEVQFARSVFDASRIGEPDRETAEAAVNRWQEIDPHDPEARLRKIELLMAGNRIFEAADQLRRFESELGIPEAFSAEVAAFRLRLIEPIGNLLK